MSTMASSSSKYPHPIYMDFNLYYLPKLNEYNINQWKVIMHDVLESHAAIGFIDGSIQPPVIPSPDYTEWKKIDDGVRDWMMATIGKDFQKQNSSLITNAKTTKDLWDLIGEMVEKPEMTHPDCVSSNKAEERPHFTQYLPLYKAAVKRDVEYLDEILEKDPTAVTALVTGASETALMVATSVEGDKEFVKKLIRLMSPEDLAMRNSFGETALVGAILAGDLEVVKLMVRKNPNLLNIKDLYNQSPLVLAAYFCENDLVASEKDSIVNYMLEVTNKECLKDQEGVAIVYGLICGRYFDICLDYLHRFRHLANSPSPLATITYTHSAFRSGTSLNPWESFIYSYLPNESLESCSGSGDVENPREGIVEGFNTRTIMSQLFWELAGKLVPNIKRIQRVKMKHGKARRLLNFICSEISSNLNGKAARDAIGSPLAYAAAMGNAEVVEQILTSFPNAIYLKNRLGRGVFHIAIANRQAKVFNLIYQSTKFKRRRVLQQWDTSGNNALHLVAHLAEETATEARLNLRSSGPGAALQMQRELQWFKAVEKQSFRQDQERRNIDGKTPAMIFNDTHEKLAKEGEQWMKDRANSGIIVATLIATILFTSAITVPGGTNSVTGLPIFSQNQAFVVFAVSDALGLFMSVSSMLMFLGILTARYAIEDFLYSLPKRLILALITLFVSIICMMIAFTAISYLVFGAEERWVLSLVSSLAAIPVLLFALMQFKPLLDIYRSTYSLQIFKQQGDDILF